jgi:hypothetical protein
MSNREPVHAGQRRQYPRNLTCLAGADLQQCANCRHLANLLYHHRGVDREEHCAIAQLCRRTDAVRPAVPGWRCGPDRAADGREGRQSRGERCLLPVTGVCGILRDEIRALARVWQAERFSRWMTRLLHCFSRKTAASTRRCRGQSSNTSPDRFRRKPRSPRITSACRIERA